MPFSAVFRNRAFTTLWLCRLLANIATLMQSVAIGWLVYTTARQTHDEKASMFLVGMIGLAQFLPMFALALIAGETADRYDRRKITFICGLLQILCAAAFTLLAMQSHISMTMIFVVAGFIGVSRAFGAPANGSLIPALVPRDQLSQALAFQTFAFQCAMILGPWLGGVLCAISPSYANAVSFAFYLASGIASFVLLQLPVDTTPKHNGATRLVMIREGLAHLWGSKVVLGAISLDLFAVLLGGVTALLPAYAKDVLFTGPEGFGHLRSAFALGAGCTTLFLAVKPVKRHAGKLMLAGVTVYGVATLCFAFSREAALSMLALAVAGAADSVSVYMRQNLVQILTPDAMRGRVTAVSSLFISASNELGEFESGVAARFLGVVGSAAFGGLGCIAVTALWSKLFPALGKADRLT